MSFAGYAQTASFFPALFQASHGSAIRSQRGGQLWLCGRTHRLANQRGERKLEAAAYPQGPNLVAV
jgi:hypothetical protein